MTISSRSIPISFFHIMGHLQSSSFGHAVWSLCLISAVSVKLSGLLYTLLYYRYTLFYRLSRRLDTRNIYLSTRGINHFQRNILIVQKQKKKKKHKPNQNKLTAQKSIQRLQECSKIPLPAELGRTCVAATERAVDAADASVPPSSSSSRHPNHSNHPNPGQRRQQ